MKKFQKRHQNILKGQKGLNNRKQKTSAIYFYEY